jgi:hypothetical protein
MNCCGAARTFSKEAATMASEVEAKLAKMSTNDVGVAPGPAAAVEDSSDSEEETPSILAGAAAAKKKKKKRSKKKKGAWAGPRAVRDDCVAG